MAFSLLLSYYVSNFGRYNKAYGSLAGVFILMLYTYYCCLRASGQTPVLGPPPASARRVTPHLRDA